MNIVCNDVTELDFGVPWEWTPNEVLMSHSQVQSGHIKTQTWEGQEKVIDKFQVSYWCLAGNEEMIRNH